MLNHVAHKNCQFCCVQVSWIKVIIIKAISKIARVLNASSSSDGSSIIVSPSHKSNRLDWIDILKGIGIILVVIGHSKSPIIITKIIFAFHMPLFFFISGYLFNYTNSFESYLDKKANRLIIPYFITYIMAFIITYFASHSQDLSAGVILNMFWGEGYPHQSIDPPLWFLTTLFCGNILFYVVLKFSSIGPAMANPTIHMGAFDINRIDIFVFIYSCILAGLGYLISKYIILPWGLDAALVSLVFFCAGYFAKKYFLLDKLNENYNIILPLSLVSLFLSVFINAPLEWGVDMNMRAYGNLFLFFLGAFSGIMISIFLANSIMTFSSIKNAFIFFGINSIVILGFHLLNAQFLTLLNVFNKNYSNLILDNWVTNCLSMLFVSVSIVYIIKNINILKRIYYRELRKK